MPQVGGGIQPPAQGQPGGQSQTRSRQEVLERTLPLPTDAKRLELPPVSGFSAQLDLAAATPSPNPASSALPKPAASASASPLPAASALVSLPSPGMPRASATPRPTSSSAANGPHVDTKITAYPDSSPTLPPPTDASPNRTAIVRILIRPSVALPLYGLAALTIGVPPDEATPRRGFSIAVFEQLKHHKERLVTVVTTATATNGVVSATTARDPLTIPAGHGYSFILYGDDLPPTPAPVMSQPPQPMQGVPAPGGIPPSPPASLPPGSTYPSLPVVTPSPTPFH